MSPASSGFHSRTASAHSGHGERAERGVPHAAAHGRASSPDPSIASSETVGGPGGGGGGGQQQPQQPAVDPEQEKLEKEEEDRKLRLQL